MVNVSHLTGDCELHSALRFVGDLLGVKVCWFYRGAFHFVVNRDRSVAIVPDTAGRYRVQTCHLTVVVDTKWVRTHDRARLAALVRDAAEERSAALAG